MDPNLPVTDVKALTEHMNLSLFPARAVAALLAAFGLLALALAAIGIYGVMAYSVAQRTREVGIRMALGAQRGDVLRMMLRQGMTLAAIGMGIGLAAALVLSRLLSNLLYGVSATDAVAFAGVSLLLGFVVLAACFIPASKAAKVDPMVALRYE
jgi:ABC-type antimicrobial peptide transport system permease subunit